MITGEQAFRQIDSHALHKLAQVFQKEVSSLIDLYLKDSEKLMEKLRVYFDNKDLKQINSIARELRLNSIEIGATKFSFLMLGLEISSSEHRINHWQDVLKRIEECYLSVVDELATLSYSSKHPHLKHAHA